MGKIGDLFVRLGLKNDDFKKGIAESKAETEGFGATISKIKGVAVAAWAAVGAAAAKMALDFIQSSNKLGDAWDITMSRVKAGWQTFVTSLSAWNWDNFFGRMKNAADAAAQLTATRDQEMEVMNSINLRKSENAQTLAQLQIAARNQKLSYAEREKAAKEYLNTVKQYYDDEQAYREKNARDTAKAWLAVGGMGFDDSTYASLKTFLGKLETDTEMMQMLQYRTSENKEEYNKYLAWANSGDDYKRLAGAFKDIYDTISGRDDTNQALIDAIIKYNYSTGAFWEENRRIFSSMNMAGAQMDKSGTDAITAAPEAAYQNALEILQRVEETTDRIDKIWKGELDQYLADVAGMGAELQPILDEIQDKITSAFIPDEVTKFDYSTLLSESLSSAVDGLTNAMQELFDSLMQLEEVDGSALTAALLTPLCETAKRMGEVMLTMAAGELAVYKSLEGPQAAIALAAAGAALIAIGAAGKAALSSIVSGGTATTTATTSSSLSSGVTSSELTVYVKGTIKGSDILISGQNTMNEWNK